MLNVMVISPTSGLAGPDICVETFTRGMDKTKYRPVVVVPPEAMLKERLNKENIACYEIMIHWWFAIDANANYLVNRLINIRQRIEPLLRIVQQESIDLIVTNTTVTLDGAVLAAEAGLPHLFIAHALFEKSIYPNIGDKTKAYAYRLMGELSHSVVCCCEHLFESFSQYIPNAVCVNNGVDTDRFGYLQRSINPKGYKLHMLCAGHYNANKQQDFIIEALGILKHQRPDLYKFVHLTCMGEGEADYKASLVQLARRLDIESHVCLESHHADMEYQYYQFNCYVNSSITENLPLSVMEAMSTGMPVLGSGNKGVRALVEEGKNGYICDTPEIMAQRIIELLENPERIEKMSPASRERICADFAVEQYIEGMQAAFDSAVADPENASQATGGVRDLYRALSDMSAFDKTKKLNVIILYPYQAEATYAIAVQEPLDYANDRHISDITYSAMEIGEVTADDLKGYDIILCVRSFHEAVHDLAVSARAMGKCFLWYIDDNYSKKTLAMPTEQQLKEANLFERMFTVSSAVIVNNSELYKLGVKLGANIELLPTYQLITKDEKPVKHPGAPIRFGFFGTLGRDSDFECVTPAILRILSEYEGKVEVEFIGYVPPELKKMPGVKHYQFMNNYRLFRQFFASRGWDFAMAPLKDTLFNQSKTNNKYREYSSFAIPAIFSKVGPYLSSIRHEENGLLVSNTGEDWYNAIKRMIDDQALRGCMGVRAYVDILKNYNIEQYASQMHRFIMTYYQYCAYGASTGGMNSPLDRSLYNAPRRNTPQHYLCTSRVLRNHRRYWITLQHPVVRGLRMYFTSYTGQCDGTISIELRQGRIVVAHSKPVNMSEIVYNTWTDFKFALLVNDYDLATLELRFLIRYTNAHRLCVYEDIRKRNFWYKLCNKLHLDGLERNVILVDEI